MLNLIGERIEEHVQLAEVVASGDIPCLLKKVADEVKRALSGGNKVLFCGNGGSAADSQHLAAEFVGRFQKERCGLSAIALTVDTSILTAVGNDYGFDRIFARQVEALGRQGDVLIAFSTSGNSANVVNAVEMAKNIGIFSVGFTAYGGGRMGHICDINIAVPVKATARAQEMHILLGHILCELVDE